MENNLTQIKFPIQSYIDKNREKIDESLVSLRLMKEIDIFLDNKKISNKSLAIDLDYSESFISQLMSGVKKINTSFINKFEKNYRVKFNFSIIEEENDENTISISSMTFLKVKISNSDLNTFRPSQVLNYSEYNGYIEYEEIIE